MGVLSMLLAGFSFAPISNSYTSGSGTDTVPSGAKQCVITMNGKGGLGQAAGPVTAGGGGGGGGFCQKTVTVSFGQSFTYSLATNVTVSSASPSVTLVANNGGNGAGGAGGAGGTASGGDINTSGTDGSSGTGGGSPNGGGFASPPNNGNAPGGGGGGGIPPNGAGGAGAAGQITFSYT